MFEVVNNLKLSDENVLCKYMIIALCHYRNSPKFFG